MPSEKKKRGACKDKLTREGYAKEQWQKEERKGAASPASLLKINTAAQTPEEKAERHAPVKRPRRGAESTQRRHESYPSNRGAAGRVRGRARRRSSRSTPPTCRRRRRRPKNLK